MACRNPSPTVAHSFSYSSTTTTTGTTTTSSYQSTSTSVQPRRRLSLTRVTGGVSEALETPGVRGQVFVYTEVPWEQRWTCQ